MAKREALGKGLDALLGGANIARRASIPSHSDSADGMAAGGSRESTPMAESDSSAVGVDSHSAREGSMGLREGTAQTSSGVRSVQPQVAHTLMLPLASITVNPHQPRRVFDPEQLELLAQSIRTYGLIQPITVRRESEGRYQLISGERRLRACRMAGLSEVPAYIREADEQALMELALVENLQREDLNPIEIALSLDLLQKEYHHTQEELGQRVGMARTSVTNYLRLLRLAPSIQYALQTKRLSMGHAKVLLGLEDGQEQERLCRLAVDQELSIRALEEMVKLAQAQPTGGISQEPKPSEGKGQAPDYLESMQHLLEQKLGWGVKIQPGNRGAGRVVISYRSNGEREELMRKLGLTETQE